MTGTTWAFLRTRLQYNIKRVCSSANKNQAPRYKGDQAQLRFLIIKGHSMTAFVSLKDIYLPTALSLASHEDVLSVTRRFVVGGW